MKTHNINGDLKIFTTHELFLACSSIKLSYLWPLFLFNLEQSFIFVVQNKFKSIVSSSITLLENTSHNYWTLKCIEEIHLIESPIKLQSW